MAGSGLITDEELRKMLKDADNSDDDSSFHGTDEADGSVDDDDDDEQDEQDEEEEEEEDEDGDEEDGDATEASEDYSVTARKASRKEKEENRKKKEIEELLKAREKLNKMKQKERDALAHESSQGSTQSPAKKTTKQAIQKPAVADDDVLSPVAGDMSRDSLHASQVTAGKEGVYIKPQKDNMMYAAEAVVVRKGTVFRTSKPELRPMDYSIIDMNGDGKVHRFCVAVLNRAHNRTEYFELTTAQEKEAIRLGTSEKGIRASFPALESRQACSDEGKDFNLDKYAGIFVVCPDVNGVRRAFIFSDSFRNMRRERAASDAARRKKADSAADATASGSNGGVRRAVVAEAEAAAAAAADTPKKSKARVVEQDAENAPGDVVVTPHVPTKPKSPMAPKRPVADNDSDFVQRAKRPIENDDEDGAAKRARSIVRVQLTFDMDSQKVEGLLRSLHQ